MTPVEKRGRDKFQHSIGVSLGAETSVGEAIKF